MVHTTLQVPALLIYTQIKKWALGKQMNPHIKYNEPDAFTELHTTIGFCNFPVNDCGSGS
jgi:hypothetical protein